MTDAPALHGAGHTAGPADTATPPGPGSAERARCGGAAPDLESAGVALPQGVPAREAHVVEARHSAVHRSRHLRHHWRLRGGPGGGEPWSAAQSRATRQQTNERARCYACQSCRRDKPVTVQQHTAETQTKPTFDRAHRERKSWGANAWSRLNMQQPAFAGGPASPPASEHTHARARVARSSQRPARSHAGRIPRAPQCTTKLSSRAPVCGSNAGRDLGATARASREVALQR